MQQPSLPQPTWQQVLNTSAATAGLCPRCLPASTLCTWGQAWLSTQKEWGMGIWDMQVLLGETRATVLTEKKVSAWIQATLLFP